MLREVPLVPLWVSSEVDAIAKGLILGLLDYLRASRACGSAVLVDIVDEHVDARSDAFGWGTRVFGPKATEHHDRPSEGQFSVSHEAAGELKAKPLVETEGSFEPIDRAGDVFEIYEGHSGVMS